MPVLVSSENEAKSFDFDGNPGKYPIFFFETIHQEKKILRNFSEEENYEINKYDSLGFITNLESAFLLIKLLKILTRFLMIRFLQRLMSLK